MIVFRWEKWDTHSTVYLKEYIRDRINKFWRWKSTILCHTGIGFKVKDIVKKNDTGRYEIVTNAGIFESDEIETTYYGNRNVADNYNSTWSR
jgi:hypothetical protein